MKSEEWDVWIGIFFLPFSWSYRLFKILLLVSIYWKYLRFLISNSLSQIESSLFGLKGQLEVVWLQSNHCFWGTFGNTSCISLPSLSCLALLHFVYLSLNIVLIWTLLYSARRLSSVLESGDWEKECWLWTVWSCSGVYLARTWFTIVFLFFYLPCRLCIVWRSSSI